MGDRVREEALGILESHVPEPLEDDILRELRAIRERSVKERTGSPV